MRFALVDCNSFYVSCERVFRPALREKPVVVLSNNDGCVIALSQEAKDANIPMGAPFFKHEKEMIQKGVAVFSSNYPLYGDMSARVMATLHPFTPALEVYSIDEAFLELPDETPPALLRKTVLQHTGIPTSVGVGATKTLAKIANRVAKKDPAFHGVYELPPPGPAQDVILARFPIGKVWGIGRQWRKKLERHNIYSAKDLRDADEGWIRQNLNVVGLRTVWELKGKPCIEFTPPASSHRMKMCSRMFGQPVRDLGDLKEAITLYATLAAEKLRREQLLASNLSVYVTTGRHAKDHRYSNNFSITLPQPTCYTPVFVQYATQALEYIYQPNITYRKAAVMLAGLSSDQAVQTDLFDQAPVQRQQSLMHAVDTINQAHGRGTVFVGSEGVQQPWQMRQDHRSPRYTTDWNGLLEVR